MVPPARWIGSVLWRARRIVQPRWGCVDLVAVCPGCAAIAATLGWGVERLCRSEARQAGTGVFRLTPRSSPRASRMVALEGGKHGHPTVAPAYLPFRRPLGWPDFPADCFDFRS